CLLALLISFSFYWPSTPRDLHSFPTRRSSDLDRQRAVRGAGDHFPARPIRGRRDGRGAAVAGQPAVGPQRRRGGVQRRAPAQPRSEEHTSELQSLAYLVCRLLLEKKNKQK